MINIERREGETRLEIYGCEYDLKCEMLSFLDCLQQFLDDYDLHSLKKAVGKIDFNKGGNKNDF